MYTLCILSDPAHWFYNDKKIVLEPYQSPKVLQKSFIDNIHKLTRTYESADINFLQFNFSP